MEIKSKEWFINEACFNDVFQIANEYWELGFGWIGRTVFHGLVTITLGFSFLYF